VITLLRDRRLGAGMPAATIALTAYTPAAPIATAPSPPGSANTSPNR